jgi:tetraacyldisaccharide 4'-kinase
VTSEPGGIRRARLVRAWREGRLGPLGFALTPVASAYRAALAVREVAYRRGILARGRLPCPVVSVGNLTVGGTGKTPAVELVARWLADDGRRVAVVSRGYGRRPGAPVELVSDGGEPRLTAERAGDEPLQLARRLPGVAVVVGTDRLAAGRWAVAHLRPDVVVLDDGFQQRRLLKDVEIVCLDARTPWGPGGLFPRGTLREPTSALARAHLIIATRVAAGANLAGLLAEIRQRAGRVPCLATDYAVEGLEDLRSGLLHSGAVLHGRAVLAFAGIAAPERLADTLTAHGAVVRDLMAFPDHHPYDARDLETVARRAHAVGATLLVTTEKDAVRLRPPGALGAAGQPALVRQGGAALPPVWALRVRLEPVASLQAEGRLPQAEGRPIDAWRAELQSRVDAAVQETRTERAP